MSLLKIAIRSFLFYWRTNFVLALGVAAATAVLTGALIVGDSMRSSLRSLALDRLGRIDEILVSDGFFRAELAREIQANGEFESNYQRAEAAILFPNGTVESGDLFDGDSAASLKRVTNVNVFGVSNSFWEFGDDSLTDLPKMLGREIIINQALADELGWPSDATSRSLLTLRIPKPTQMPADSALGKKDDLVESLVDLDVVRVIPDKSIGRFGMHVSQLDSPNIFVPIDLLRDALSRSALKHKNGPQANVIFLSGGNNDRPPTSEQSESLLRSIRPELEDLGLTIKEVNQLKSESDEFAFQYYSLSTDRLVLSDEISRSVNNALPDAVEVFTYLANDIRKEHQDFGVPFSMVAAIDIGPEFPLLDESGQLIEPLKKFDIVLNRWAAQDIQADVGSRIQMRYFEPESTHGSEKEKDAFFEVKAIARLAAPDTPFRIRGKKIVPAQYLSESPTLANDPDLTPEVPGLTDAQSIENWNLPFATADRIREVDDDYWNDYRTTPKAFISLQRGQLLWGSRFGRTTSFRIPKTAGKIEQVRQKLLDRFHDDQDRLGFSIVPVKRNAIAASSGSTPFDVLFLALSMFVIGSALILVSLLFRLALQRRVSEVGTLLAVGLNRSAPCATLLAEMSIVSLMGALMGIAIGVGYAAIMVIGLKTWWLGAISKPILELKVSPIVLAIGAVSGLVICMLTIVMTVRGTRNQPIRQLLGGDLDSPKKDGRQKRRWQKLTIYGLLMGAVILSIVASFLGGEPQAGAFLGSGFLVLSAALISVYRFLNATPAVATDWQLSLGGLAAMSGKRNPLRSTLTIGLVAVASFLIVAVSSFRLTPTAEGTAGFDLLAKTDQPVFESLDADPDSDFVSYSLRVKSGEDASCTNLYQSTQPQVLGVDQDFIDSFATGENVFRWASIDSASWQQREQPWKLLNQSFDDGAIPVVIDKNTANYSLKIFATGGEYRVTFDSGETVVFRVVGFLENSILQGNLIVAEENFVKAFPGIAGYRMFLVRAKGGLDKDAETANLATQLEQRYSDQGLDAQSAAALLAKYQQVQNTYISTFQTLGGLGLLLGTFGLATVQIRSVLERQKELGLMRSVGFSRGQLSRMVLLENMWLLGTGLLVGVVAAPVTTLPHYFIGGASIPWNDLAVLFCLILVFGLLAAFLASRTISKLPLIQSLRV